MLRNVVGSALAGFQKSAVSGEFDEEQIRHKRLRQDISTLEGLVRQLLVETGALRAELGAVKEELAQAKAAGALAAAPVAQEPAVKAEVVAPAKPVEVKPVAPVAPPAEAKPAAAQPAAPVEAKPVEAKPAPAPVAPVEVKPAVEAKPAPAAPPKETSSFSNLAALASSGQLGPIRHADDASTDIEAYRERMRANGRSVELAGEGLNTAADGAQFIGPVDNDSSRAKAVGKVLTIDQWECIACGTCVEQTADVYYLPDGGKAEVLKQAGPMDLIQDAIDACPVTCISWVKPSELEEQHSHGGFEG